MNGPEHYREAERLAEMAGALNSHDPEQREVIVALTALAQVHATLAGAAATALNRPDGEGMTTDDYRMWMQVARVPRS